VVIVAALVLVTAPLTEAIARARTDVAQHRLVLDIARSRNAESVTLARTASPPRTEATRTAIDRVLSQERVAYAPADAGSDAEPVRIVIGEARFDVLVRALEMLAREDGVRIVEATLTARVDPGTVRAELALAR
jgi:type II secretory pathway component PulM